MIIKSLCKVKVGKSFCINSIHLNIVDQRKLKSKGVNPGAKITILQGEINSSYIVEINDSRLMLNWDTARGIRVKTEI